MKANVGGNGGVTLLGSVTGNGPSGVRPFLAALGEMGEEECGRSWQRVAKWAKLSATVSGSATGNVRSGVERSSDP